MRSFKLNNFFDQTTPPTKYVSVNSGLGCTNSELIFVIGKNKLKFSWDNDTGNSGVIDKILYRR